MCCFVFRSMITRPLFLYNNQEFNLLDDSMSILLRYHWGLVCRFNSITLTFQQLSITNQYFIVYIFIISVSRYTLRSISLSCCLIIHFIGTVPFLTTFNHTLFLTKENERHRKKDDSEKCLCNTRRRQRKKRTFLSFSLSRSNLNAP